jgi:hypothetical protein
LVVVKVQKVRQSLKVAEVLGHGRQGVVTEIERTEALQAANLGGYLGQIVVGQHERLQIDLFPHRFGDAAEAMLPEVEIPRVCRR